MVSFPLMSSPRGYDQQRQGHHQLSPEKSNLNQGRLTDAPLPRTIVLLRLSNFSLVGDNIANQ